jgi:hypothetical protein
LADSLALPAGLAGDGGREGGDERLSGDQRFELGIEGACFVDVALRDLGHDQGHPLESIAV